MLQTDFINELNNQQINDEKSEDISYVEELTLEIKDKYITIINNNSEDKQVVI